VSTRGRLREGIDAFAAVWANRSLRRLQLANAGSVLGNWAYLVALLVYAYEQGGAADVALVSVLRLIPAALVSPFTSALGDRVSRKAVMIAADLLRAALMVGIGLVIAVGGPTGAVYALVTVAAVVATTFRPALAAMLPSLARTPEELTAANVSTSSVTSVGAVVGPMIGAVLLAATTVEAVFYFNAVTFVLSALLVAGVRLERAERAVKHPRNPLGREAIAGFAVLAADSRMRLLTALFSAQTLVGGGLAVFIAVTAFELTDAGQEGVGFLNTALGVGGILGGIAALGIIGRQRLASDFGLGLVLMGAPLALLGAVPGIWAGLLALGVIGLGNTVTDVSGFTLLQRSVPDEVLARAFGALQSLLLGALGLGALLAPLLIELLGARFCLIVVGSVLPALVAISWTSLRTIDGQLEGTPRELVLLERSTLFAPLPPQTLEALSVSLVRVETPAGTSVIRAGERGDRFYFVDAGSLHVEPLDGSPSTLEPGDGFGEIALLRDVPRTASVTASEDSVLYALDRDRFLAAVTGDVASLQAANDVIAIRLGTADPILAGSAVR
jgi:MFS family permease